MSTVFNLVCLWWTPHPVIVTIRDTGDYIRVLLYSYHTTITGWGVLLKYAQPPQSLLSPFPPSSIGSSPRIALRSCRRLRHQSGNITAVWVWGFGLRSFFPPGLPSPEQTWTPKEGPTKPTGLNMWAFIWVAVEELQNKL